MKKELKEKIKESIHIKNLILEDDDLLKKFLDLVKVVKRTLKKGNKIILFGNGGSAAQAQHIACEFVVRFKKERQALPAIALNTDTSILTAIGNDYSFDSIFERQIVAFGKKDDVCIGISTSGNSQNVIRALKKAKEKGILTAGFTGKDGGKMKKFCDILINVPSDNTPRIQEVHILLGHLLCEFVEKDF